MPVKQLDARGLKCPMPIVKAKQALDAMAPGDLLEITATDPGSVSDFQGWTKVNKRAVLKSQRQEKDESGRDLFIHLIERSDG
jgi:tRNA 2-thiouridine synthesizing protein A